MDIFNQIYRVAAWIPSERLRRFAPPLIGLLLAASTPTLHAASVTVFAAASLADVLKAIAARYEKSTGDTVVFNFAASSTLARHIAEGAPADVFFSADESKMDQLEKAGLLIPQSRRTRLSNTLVIVTAADHPFTIPGPKTLAGPGIKRIALADPRAVPAGIYAQRYLESLGLWRSIEPKVVPCDNVRAALAAVESGNVQAGIVYKTDAASSKKVKIAFEIPRADGPAVRYPVAALAGSTEPQAASRFLRFLDSSEAAEIFERFGFIVLARKFHNESTN